MAGPRQYVGRITKQCELCGVDVTRKASGFREHVFCSSKCYGLSDFNQQRLMGSNFSRYAGRRESRACENCGTSVERPVSQFNARTFCSRECQKTRAKSVPNRQINSRGYVLVFVGKDYPGAMRHGHVLEHRKVMQDFLGRPLITSENIHHVNGDKTDNRLENLELWSRSQPSGQRVKDKIAWAKEFLAFYGVQP